MRQSREGNVMVLHEPIPDEVEIVWTEDVSKLRYVREVIEPRCYTRMRPIPWTGPGRRVGYSVLSKDARNDGPSRGYGFTRRVFWVRDNDGDVEGGPYSSGGAPSEGVDPDTVKPGVPGERTEKSDRPTLEPARQVYDARRRVAAERESEAATSAQAGEEKDVRSERALSGGARHNRQNVT